VYSTHSPPTVLCIGGHDPSGGAGIIADAEAVRAAGAFALTVITALTDQDTAGLRRVFPQPAEQIEEQCRSLIADGRPAAIKLGLIGDIRLVSVLAALCDAYPRLPVVLDPVLASGAGQSVADSALIQAILTALVPRATLVTPNVPEARRLGGSADTATCARTLRVLGAHWVLVTGTHEESAEVTNRLYGDEGELAETWPRLPGEYHGSGCTLASAVAARLALGFTMPAAVAAAQTYTWNSLARAWRTGRGQLTPNRLFALPGDGANP
jgi:hydroxymethylpyrimidine/phosphomethylpyrimidine kinase